MKLIDQGVIVTQKFKSHNAGADLGFIKGGGLTQGTNLLGRGVQSTFPSMLCMLELGGSGGMPPRKILKNRY